MLPRLHSSDALRLSSLVASSHDLLSVENHNLNPPPNTNFVLRKIRTMGKKYREKINMKVPGELPHTPLAIIGITNTKKLIPKKIKQNQYPQGSCFSHKRKQINKNTPSENGKKYPNPFAFALAYALSNAA